MSTHPKFKDDGSSLNPAKERVDLTEIADLFRLDAGRKIDSEHRSQHGQYFTPPKVARLMAAMFETQPTSIHLLDAGAGVGALITAVVSEAIAWEKSP